MFAKIRVSRAGLVLICAFSVFVGVAQKLKSAPRADVAVELQVALPLFVQVFMSAGDRFLAANMASVRALIADTEKMRSADYTLLGRVQKDAAWLNPAHEDNYYIAAAILSWNEQVDAAQTVLGRAMVARQFDYQPAFYFAFNLLHFKADPIGASAVMRESAAYLPDGQNRLQMQNLAAIWLERSGDADLAIRVVEAMADEARRKDFQGYLRARVVRLKALRDLRLAVTQYQHRFARTPVDLDELVSSGIIPAVPQDPLRIGFAINTRGEVVSPGMTLSQRGK